MRALKSPSKALPLKNDSINLSMIGFMLFFCKTDEAIDIFIIIASCLPAYLLRYDFHSILPDAYPGIRIGAISVLAAILVIL
ncbi:hypothetical protein [Bacteroides fragilis]|mgnify:CR=1 FL=1|uniref:hypothetical protein n=1 Tax=Bacteroides fragilis TaxID=817 RepID=UPI0022AAB5E7|nr:hypothetical protein [Bacteroides fragilis]MCZ2530981.1 hypothetical protein [Bacteroides fragilis]